MPTLGYGTTVTIGAIFGKVTTACKFEKKLNILFSQKHLLGAPIKEVY